MSKPKKTLVISISILALLLVSSLLAYKLLAPKPVEGAKTVTIVIDHMKGEDKTLEIHTDAEYLSEALQQEGLVEGTESEYGLWITAIDGETADDSLQQWWGYTKSGEYVETGADQTIIEDGDSFEFTLHEGY